MTSATTHIQGNFPDLSGQSLDKLRVRGLVRYAGQIIGNGQKIPGHVEFGSGGAQPVAAGAPFGKLNNVLSAFHFPSLPRHVETMTEDVWKCLSLKMTELFRRAGCGVKKP